MRARGLTTPLCLAGLASARQSEEVEAKLQVEATLLVHRLPRVLHPRKQLLEDVL